MGQIGFELDTVQQTETIDKVCPNWNVLLLNDDYHSFDFVILLLIKIFRKDMDEALAITMDIHNNGQGIAATCSKERAELYLEQVASMKEGKKGAIGCVIEPAE
jgi:ATP-dependent Clp protease adaptor protein ClpS